MRVEKITKRKRKQDDSIIMFIFGAGLLLWAFISNIFNNPMVGLVLFLIIGAYALLFLRRNDLGENKKQERIKKQDYNKGYQTFVYSKNHK